MTDVCKINITTDIGVNQWLKEHKPNVSLKTKKEERMKELFDNLVDAIKKNDRQYIDKHLKTSPEVNRWMRGKTRINTENDKKQYRLGCNITYEGYIQKLLTSHFGKRP